MSEVTFSYLVPVHVTVEDGVVKRVVVIDDTPVEHATAVELDTSPDEIAAAVEAAENGQSWPSWEFGY